MCKDHDCQDHLEWIEQEEFDGDNDVFINSFWECEVCGEAVEPKPQPNSGSLERDMPYLESRHEYDNYSG